MKKRIAFLCATAILICSLVSGATINVCAAGGSWKQNATGWWYENADGSYPTNKWENISGKWYYFDQNGYAKTGWFEDGGEWYFFDKQGCDAYTGWKLIDGSWYYFYPDSCYAARGWQKINGSWYYFGLKDSNAGKYVENPNYNGFNCEAGTIKGIDVSVHQGTINWTAVRNEGISYAMVRVGNNRNFDLTFDKNMRGASAAGLYTGVYFYSKATSESQSLGDAQWVINHLKGYNVNYPVAIDLEDATQGSLGADKVTQIAKVFCDEIRAAGYTPMVYCNENWARNLVKFNALPGVGRWIARYNGYYDTGISRDIWQSGSTLRLNGIGSKFVDIDFSRTDYAGVGNRTSPVSWYTPSKGVWILNGVGYWYAYVNGGYPTNKWEFINSHWYYFNNDGYIVKGWQFINGAWYYFDKNGAMTTGWQFINGAWYYLNSSGAMLTGWQFINGAWYFLYGNGAMATGWQFINGAWYYMNSSGAMATGWIFVGGCWYYMNASGAMHTGWLQYGGSWYYLYGNGVMATNAWIGYYWVNAQGVWS